MINKDIVVHCHEKGMKVIPWTVNTLEGMKVLKKMDIDGKKSDYPGLFLQIK